MISVRYFRMVFRIKVFLCFMVCFSLFSLLIISMNTLKVKHKNWLWKLTPTSNVATALFGTIFLPKNHTFKEDDPLIVHEETHLIQQKREGLRFYFKYIFSREYRLMVEAEAYARQAVYRERYKGVSVELSINEYVSYLSSGLYGKMDRVKAKNTILLFILKNRELWLTEWKEKDTKKMDVFSIVKGELSEKEIF